MHLCGIMSKLLCRKGVLMYHVHQLPQQLGAHVDASAEITAYLHHWCFDEGSSLRPVAIKRSNRQASDRKRIQKELFSVATLKRQTIATAKNVFPSSRNLWNKRRKKGNQLKGGKLRVELGYTLQGTWLDWGILYRRHYLTGVYYTGDVT